MDGDEPAGGQWNFDADNRQAAAEGWRTGGQGSACRTRGGRSRTRSTTRSGATSIAGSATATSPSSGWTDRAASRPPRSEALRAFQHFVDHRLTAFGPYEDAMLAGDPWMAHSLISSSLNLGLLDPLRAGRSGSRMPTARAMCRSPRRRASSGRSSAGGTTSGICTGTSARTTARRNAVARQPGHSRAGSPNWMPTPSRPVACRRCWPASGITRGCTTFPRLMVLGNYAMQRGWRPVAGDRLVPPRLRRRVRLGDGAERRRACPSTPTAARSPPSPTPAAAPTSTG